MDHVALRLDGTGTWVRLAGASEAKKPVEVVVRAFDAPVRFAAGDGTDGPRDQGVEVPAGEGRRLSGLAFFVRANTACRITYRGL